MTKQTVLLVDDEAIIRKTLAGKLSDEGFTVLTADGGASALAFLNTTSINLVITDLMMEGMTGIEVLEAVKSLNPETAVIILTGYGDLTSAIDALRLGADDYLLKPCDLNELLFRMHKCLEKQSLKKMVKLYEEILPICLDCKKIRDDTGAEHGKGVWIPVDQYLTKKAGKSMSHGYCPECGQHFLEKIEQRLKK
ncbi:MAG: response regulator [Proteobacteria bacterium]|nr:response regulator [Desulfobulbaceae bacterium]MBU4154206.1 response regulator [Pseudomonadota bacterium]MDP2105507.1 response regulator [Desulfobulbaceae bacterium]